jgi:protein-L-isoaspartate(D-aspartate) O-methyltransferase
MSAERDAADEAPRDTDAARRARMVDEQLARRGVRDADVLAAMRAVPRHLFVPDDLVHVAYSDGPLPIGYGQTISQPYMVAYMTELLRVNVRSRVLDVGAGSGYQTAVLAEVAGEVFAMERVAALEELARERLERLGYANVHLRTGDGCLGWPEVAPFDGIMVAAAAPAAPQPLLAQLAERGRLVIPLGDAHRDQVLTVYERRGDGFSVEEALRCRFVPLVGAEEWGAPPSPDDLDDDDSGGGSRPPRWDEVGP